MTINNVDLRETVNVGAAESLFEAGLSSTEVIERREAQQATQVPLLLGAEGVKDIGVSE